MVSIVIDLDTSDANNAIQHSELIQTKNYEKLKKKVTDDVRFASAGKDEDKQNSLTYFIDGTRGAGKSTFLRAAYNALTIKSPTSQDATLGKLALIDPSKIEAAEIILLPILRELKQQVDDASCRNPSDEALHQTFRERFERLAGGLSLFSASHDPLQDVDPDIFLDWGIERAGHSSGLRKNLHQVIEAACALLKVEALVLGFDDADTNAKKGREVLECIRKYLDTPKLIVLVTGDMELYSHLVRDHCFDSLGERLHRMDSARNSHRERMVDHMEEQYLLKLFPVARRLQLKPLWNLLKAEQADNQAPVFLLKCSAWNNPHPLEVVLEQILKAGLRLKANTDFALFREYLLKLPLRSVLQVFAQCAPHFIENDVENGKTEWLLQQAFCEGLRTICLLYTSPSPRDGLLSRMPSSA